MSKTKSGIWGIALPLSVVFLGAAYYVKVPEVRKEVDARTPIVRNLLGRFVQESGTQVIVMQGEQDPMFSKPKPAPAANRIASASEPEPVITEAAEAAAPPVESAPPPPVAPLDLQKIAADPTLWPKKVTLHKPTKFPAVLNGKIVGELVAPAGAEATLKLIKDDKVGLEFNGGGAWLPATETDLIARVRATR